MKSLITLILIFSLAYTTTGAPYLNDCCKAMETSLDSGQVEDGVETAIQRNVRATMVGTWESTEYPFIMKNGKKKTRKEGAFLQYTFQPDGTYTTHYGDASETFQEKGTWTISANGKKIQLTAEDATKRQTILIKYLEFDELVLQHDMIQREKTFSPGDRSVFFHKA